MIVQDSELPMTIAQIEELKYHTLLFPELDYEEHGYQVQMKGLKKLGKQEVYQILMTAPSGKSEILYFDKLTGLKLKSENTKGSITYSAYKEKGGVQFPHILKISSPSGQMRAQMVSIELNTYLSPATFKAD